LKLADRALPTYWTATHGNVVFVADGHGISVKTQQAAPTDPLSLYAGEPVELGSVEEATERQRIRAGSKRESGKSESSDYKRSETPEGLAIKTLQYNAAGDDRENLNGEYIVFNNSGSEPLALSGWTVEDEVSKQYTFPVGFTLNPGATVTLRTGDGTNTETTLYWDAKRPIWNNGGDTVIVRTENGERVLVEGYS
jgi:competence protein ComEC